MLLGDRKLSQGGTVGKSIGMRIFAAALLAVPLLAHAVGLGNLRVLSALGEPLNAEIQIVSEHPGEMDSVSARLASQDAFHAAGIDFNPVLLGIQIRLEHSGGKPVLKLTTKKPVDDPFLDMLVELQWSSGRLVREYTFLLDPPTYKMPKETAVVPSPAPMAKPAPAAKAAPLPPAATPIEEKPLEAAPTAAAPTKAAPAKAPATEAAPTKAAPTEATAAEAGPPPPPSLPVPKAPVTYKVKNGDTLGEIARRNLPSGVTYNQMLIALYRANKGAFIRGNINLVRAGKILDIPDHEAVATIDPDTATRLVRSQSADFAAYRRKLAAAAAAKAASASAGEQAVSGSIGTTPEKAVPAEQKDELKLSKADTGKPSGAMAQAASADDQAAQARALKEAQSRVAELEQNVSDLQKLVKLKQTQLDLKSKQLAELQQKAAATLPAPTPTAPAVQKPEAPKAEAPKPAATPSAAAQPAAQAQVPAQSPAPAAQPPKPAAAPAPKPAPKPKPRVITPRPPAPSILDELLDNTAALGGLGAVLVLLLGFGAWKWQRKKRSAGGGAGGGSFEASVGPGGEASVLGGAGAASVGAISSQGSVSQASVAGMEADEVDPIAEADVYMAYGRDAQAEEILKEALQKDAKRPAIHSKLLEIYAARRDTTSFEETARKLQALSGGSSPDWEKAAALGRSIDPQNPMYGGSAGAAPIADLGHEPAPAPNLDFDLDATSAPVAMPDIPLDIGSESGKETGSEALDFELGTTTTTMRATDFSKGGTLIMDKNAEEQPESAPGPEGLDFDLGMGGTESRKPADADDTMALEAPTAQTAATPAAEATGGMDFNFNLDTDEDKTAPVPEPTAPAAPLDLSSISLDLDAPGESPAATAGASGDPKWQEVATKLDLAKAYEEMGDKDGARELLNEVVKEGDSTQQSQAQQMLSSLG